MGTRRRMEKISYLVIEKCKKITALFCFLFFSFYIKAETIYEMDFSSGSGNVKEWFYNKNWEFHEDINDMNLRFEKGSLVIEPIKDQIGVMNREFEKKDYLTGEIKLRIEWGVDQYPIGADWSGPKEKTRNSRQAIPFMILFLNAFINMEFQLNRDDKILKSFLRLLNVMLDLI